MTIIALPPRSRRMKALPTPSAWAEAIAEWETVQRSAHTPQSTLDTRLGQLRRLGRVLPGTHPWQVTGPQLRTWTASQDWSRETRRSWRNTLRAFYGWAATEGHVETSPALSLPAVKPAQPRPRPAPEQAYAAGIARSDQRTRLILMLGAEVGMRRTEIALVHSRDLEQDLSGWSLTVHGKGDKDRLVPLPAHLAETLRALPAGWAFPGDQDGHLSPRWIGKLATRALPGIWTLHTLRHRFATKAYAIDSDVFAVQDLLGHASPATTRVYVQIPTDRLRRVVDAVAAA